MSRLVAVVVLVGIASACAGDRASGPVVPVAATVELVLGDASVRQADSFQVAVTARDSAGAVIAQPVATWTLDPPGAARVADGWLTGLERGSVQVRVTVDGVADSGAVMIEDGFLVHSLRAATFWGATCAVDQDSVGYCWAGQSSHLAAWSDDTLALPVPGAVQWRSIVPGAQHVCGVAVTGIGYCWGRNFRGQLGVGPVGTDSDSLVAPHGGMTFSLLLAGEEDYTCGVGSSGGALCWGHNNEGQLGRGFRSLQETDAQPPAGPPALNALDSDVFNSCGIGVDGVTYCWGFNPGTGTASSDSAVAVAGGHSFSAVSAGFYFSCGVTGSGQGYCWGTNSSGQLGTGDSTTHLTPEPVTAVPGLATISAGHDHACGLTTAGEVWCWGGNGMRQLGDGTDTGRPTPVQVLPGMRFQEIAAGYFSTCGVTADGAVFCWGRGHQDPWRVLRGD